MNQNSTQEASSISRMDNRILPAFACQVAAIQAALVIARQDHPPRMAACARFDMGAIGFPVPL